MIEKLITLSLANRTNENVWMKLTCNDCGLVTQFEAELHVQIEKTKLYDVSMGTCTNISTYSSAIDACKLAHITSFRSHILVFISICVSAAFWCSLCLFHFFPSLSQSSIGLLRMESKSNIKIKGQMEINP